MLCSLAVAASYRQREYNNSNMKRGVDLNKCSTMREEAEHSALLCTALHCTN